MQAVCPVLTFLIKKDIIYTKANVCLIQGGHVDGHLQKEWSYGKI